MAKTENKYRNYTHLLVLYPDDPTHVDALEQIKKLYDYAYILHDRDYYTEKDEKKSEGKYKAGEMKKPHWHIVLRFKSQCWNTAIAKELGIGANYFENPRNFESSLLYLIHFRDSDKAEYDIKEVHGNLRIKLKQKINSLMKVEDEKVSELIDYIEQYEGYLRITAFSKYCALNGYWAEFRRSGTIFCKIIDEHNSFIKEVR